MHESYFSQVEMGQEHHSSHHAGFGADGWIGMTGYSSQHQSPDQEYTSYAFMPPGSQSLPIEPSYSRMAPAQSAHSAQQQLLPLIVPSHPTWPSMLTNPAGYQHPPIAIPPAASTHTKMQKLPAIHTTSTPRKTLTDADRKRICIYHEENPTVKQTEIGAMFGVERSTISKVLRQKEKYLFPEDRNVSPVKRAKGKFPDIERALVNWVRNSQKQGIPLTDAAIKEKAKFFATTVGNTESHLKANSTSWLEKFKQKNNIGSGKMLRRASETNVSESGSLNPDSTGPTAVHTPKGISPTSPLALASPSPLSAAKSEESTKGDNAEGYLDFGTSNGSYKQSNSQSTTSLSSALTDAATSSFSGGATSPTTPINFAMDNNCGGFMPAQQARQPPPNSNFQRPRSQTFPMLGIDPAYISAGETSDNMTPKFMQSSTAPSSALESPEHEMPPFRMDSALAAAASSPLHHSASTGSMAPPPLSTTPTNTAISPQAPGSTPSSPSQDEACRACDTLLMYFNSQGPSMVDQNEYITVLKLTERLRLHQNGHLPGGLHRIPEQEGESMKMEQSVTASG